MAEGKYEVGRVTSRDGTPIGYRRYGSGSGLVLVQGAMGTVEQFAGLATALSEVFTVYVAERRGRGLSPLPYRPEHSIQRDVEDLEAILAKTGSRFVFGLSSGGLIALMAARSSPGISRLALFEPPLFAQRPVPTKELERFTQAMARNDPGTALTVAGQAVQLNAAVRFIPGWIMTAMVNRLIAAEDRKPRSEEPTLREITATLQYDFRIIAESAGRIDRWKSVSIPVLLLGGGKSPTWLKQDLNALEPVLPHVIRITLPALDHGAAWDRHPQRNARGNPTIVAAELSRFFQAP